MFNPTEYIKKKKEKAKVIGEKYDITIYSSLCILLCLKEIKKYSVYSNLKRLKNSPKDRERYTSKVEELEREVSEIKCGKRDNLKFEIKENSIKNTIRERYMIGSLDWLGSLKMEDIDESTMKVCKNYNILVEDAVILIILSHKIMGFESGINVNDSIIEILKDKGSERAENYESSSDLKTNIEKTKEKIVEITGRDGYISSREYELMYLEKLEEDRGKSKGFDKFLNELQSYSSYGIISTFCEMDEEGQGLINDYLGETISWENY